MKKLKKRWRNAVLLNNIFWDINFWTFSKMFSKGSWNKNLWNRSWAIENEKQEAISKMKTCEIEGLLRVVMANDYISDIPLYFKETNFVIIRGGGKMSVRSDLDLMPFYKQCNDKGIEIGGHPNSAGAYHKDEMVLIEEFYNYLKEL